MTLTRIRILGRFRLTDGREVNVHKGIRKERGTDVYFFLYRQQRQLLSPSEVSAATRIG
jgi:hypothetical protein